MRGRGRIMRLIKTAYLLTFFVLITTISVGRVLFFRALYLLAGVPFSGNIVHRAGIFWGKSFFRYVPGWNLVIENPANVRPDSGPYVIVANHESSADIFALFCLGMQFRWLAKESVFSMPGIGFCMRWAGYIPIRRGDRASHRAALQMSKDVLKSGISMAYFPEGTRSTTGRPGSFKVGAFKLSKETSVAVLPVALRGAGELLYKSSVYHNDATLRMRVLKPMVPKGDETVEEFAERVRAVIVSNHAELCNIHPERFRYGSPSAI